MPSKFGDDGREVTPVPIPNTEVKLSSADGSWDLVPVRVGRRQAILRRVRMTRLFVFLTSNQSQVILLYSISICSLRFSILFLWKQSIGMLK